MENESPHLLHAIDLVINIKGSHEGTSAPEGERFIEYMYRIRHDLCNMCHRRMQLRALKVC